jgi:hypothetical protein
MKAKLEFDLPEEREEFETAVKAGKVESALLEFANWLRAEYKYGPNKYPNFDGVEQELDSHTISVVRGKFHDCTNSLD